MGPVVGKVLIVCPVSLVNVSWAVTGCHPRLNNGFRTGRASFTSGMSLVYSSLQSSVNR